MKLHIFHHTRYRYGLKVPFGPHQLLFRPRENYEIALTKFSVRVLSPHRLRWIRDVFENNVGLLDLTEESQDLSIEMESMVHVSDDNPFNFVIMAEAKEFPFEFEPALLRQVSHWQTIIYHRDVEKVREWIRPHWTSGARVNTLELLQALNKDIYGTIRNQRRERKGVQSPAETLKTKSGACRDLATLFMEACHLLGLPARFVSGYLYSSHITNEMSMHAWAEVYLPGAGWIGFDPSWGILADFHYIPVAVASHPESIPPISGTYFGYAKDYLGSEVVLWVRRVDEPLAEPSSTQCEKDQADKKITQLEPRDPAGAKP